MLKLFDRPLRKVKDKWQTYKPPSPYFRVKKIPQPSMTHLNNLKSQLKLFLSHYSNGLANYKEKTVLAMLEIYRPTIKNKKTEVIPLNKTVEAQLKKPLE